MSLCAAAGVVVTARDSTPIVEDEPVASELTFERIYDEYFTTVERWIRAFGGRSSDIPDLAQEVFVVAVRRLPEFDGQNVGGWLYQITRRKMRDYRRLAWVKHYFTERNAGTYEAPAVRADQLTQLESREKQQLLERLLNRLPADQRATFVLFELDGLTGLEIAETQQVPINTVWARIHRARQKLQAAAVHARPDLKR
jgi:RNA polymerase sigma-70 factor (ECF subfamily)